MESCCNGTRVPNGYEIVGSVTVGERFAGSWVKRRCSSFELVSIALCTPSRGRGALRVNCQIRYWARFVIGPRSLTDP